MDTELLLVNDAEDSSLSISEDNNTSTQISNNLVKFEPPHSQIDLVTETQIIEELNNINSSYQNSDNENDIETITLNYSYLETSEFYDNLLIKHLDDFERKQREKCIDDLLSTPDEIKF